MHEARGAESATGGGRQAHGKGSAKALARLPVQTIRTANTILNELGVLQELPQEVLPELIAKTVVRRGKGGRQKQLDPLLDPRFAGLEPSKVARIMANREAAARSKLKAKLLKELQLQKVKAPPGSSMPAPKPQPTAGRAPAAKGTMCSAAAAQKENTAAAAAAEVEALAALDCLAAVAAEEELLQPDSGTPAHCGAADQHGWQLLDAGPHRQRDSRLSSSSAAATAARPGQLRCDEQQLPCYSSDEQGDWQDDEAAADRAAHLRVLRRLQQIQQQRHGHADASGGSSDSGRRKRASPDNAPAIAQARAAAAAAAAAATGAAGGDQPHRSKRKRHMTSRAAEAAAAGLIPTAGLSPDEVLVATAAHSAQQLLQQQPKVLGRGPAAAAAAAACGGDDLSRQIHTEVQLLSSIDKATVMEALERLFRLLTSLLLSHDDRTDGALALALQGLLGLLRCGSCGSGGSTCGGKGSGGANSRESSGWPDLQLTALAVLDTLARQAAMYRDCIVACGAPVSLVRLMEGAGSAAVQLAAVQALQALVAPHGRCSTVDAIAEAHGVEVLLLLLARGKQGSAMRQAAASCLCSMADAHPGHAEVAVAASGVRHMLQSAGAASSSRA